MPTIFNLPSLEDGANQATVERYFQALGARVEQGQPLAVVFTDRFEWEIPATTAGTITNIVVQPGTSVAIGTPLLEIEVGSGAAIEPSQQQQFIAELRATPLARRIAATHGLSLADVVGSGRGGRITRSDVLGILQIESEVAASPSPNGRASVESSAVPASVAPPNGISNQQIAAAPSAAPAPNQTPVVNASRLAENKHSLQAVVVPHALTAVEVDMTAVQKYVVTTAAGWAKRGIWLDVNICVAYVTVSALSQHRLLNSAWTDDGIIVWQRINLGWSVHPAATPVVIAHAADLSLQGLARSLHGQPHVDSTITPTFTIAAAASAFWSEQPAPLGHSVVLHIGASSSRPSVVAEHGIDTIKLRPLSILTLSYDARIAGQQQVDAFLSDIKQRLEHFDALC